MITLDDIKKRVEEIAEKIKAESKLLPTYGYSRDFAYPHIEADNLGLLHYVIVERGQEIERRITNKLDDLLYWIFVDITFTMSCEYELKNRIEDKDGRRIIFDKQEELLGQINETWALNQKEKHKNILIDAPYDDLAGLRATYFGQLRQQGLSETEINKLAYEKYPKN